MKKLFTVFAITILAFSCSSKKTSEETKTNVNKIKEVTSKITEKVNEKVEEAGEELGEYAGFIKEAKEYLKPYSITDVFVAPYSKGIDIILTTDKKDLKKDKFMEIAKNLVSKFKKETGLNNAKMGVALEYQPDPKENAEQLYGVDVK